MLVMLLLLFEEKRKEKKKKKTTMSLGPGRLELFFCLMLHYVLLPLCSH